MLTEICQYLRNWFGTDDDRHFGRFEIKNGQLMSCPYVTSGKYFRIVGSVLNDGVHAADGNDLYDEVFDGAVWEMRLPPAFLSLVADIEAYQTNAGAPSAFVSESFGGYAYQKATDASGAPIGWQQVFADRLRIWRKL